MKFSFEVTIFEITRRNVWWKVKKREEEISSVIISEFPASNTSFIYFLEKG